MTTPDRLSRTRGCLLGGAVGDALGAPVEFLTLAEIREQFGNNGIRDFVPVHNKLGAITDDTQMTMFTAEGMLRALCRWSHRGICHAPTVVWYAYRRWLITQDLVMQGTPPDEDGWLIKVPALRSRRAPGRTCVTALQNNVMGTIEKPINQSMGCGGVMRAAPGGLLGISGQYREACEYAALTHGHPGGWVSAGCLAAIVAGLIQDRPLGECVEKAIGLAKHEPDDGGVAGALESARSAAATGRADAETVETLGGGWIGPQALAIAVYAALAAAGDFEKGVILAVNHSGDSDSTGAIAGNILGASSGVDAIPRRWLEHLELRDEITALADDLVTGFREDEAWFDRYPGH